VIRKNKESRKIPASNFTLGYSFTWKLFLNDRLYSIYAKLPYFFSVLRPIDLAKDFKVFFRFYMEIMA